MFLKSGKYFFLIGICMLVSSRAVGNKSCCSNGDDKPFNMKQVAEVVNRAIVRHTLRGAVKLRQAVKQSKNKDSKGGGENNFLKLFDKFEHFVEIKANGKNFRVALETLKGKKKFNDDLKTDYVTQEKFDEWAEADAWLAKHAKNSKKGYLRWQINGDGKIVSRYNCNGGASECAKLFCKPFSAKRVALFRCGKGTVSVDYKIDDYGYKTRETPQQGQERRIKKLLGPHGLAFYYDKGLLSIHR